MGGILSGIREVEPLATVKGIDLGSEYIEQGKIRGIQLEVGNSASEAMINPKKYDLIILSHVLEHFLDLDSELNNISLLLKEDGIVYIEVPGLLKIHETYIDILNYFQNAHIRHFSLGTLQQVMSKYGYELLEGNENVQSVFRYTGHVCKENRQNDQYKKNMQYLKNVEKNNWFFLYVYRPLSRITFLKELKRKLNIVSYK